MVLENPLRSSCCCGGYWVHLALMRATVKLETTVIPFYDNFMMDVS